MNVLIFSKDALWHGGVVNFIETLKKNFSNNISVDQFLIGGRIGNTSALFKLFIPFIDSIRLIKLMMTKRYDVYHLNPSLNAKSILRDGLFLFLVRLFSSRKIVVCFHGWENSIQYSIEKSETLKFIFRLIFDKADVILVLARPFKDWLCKIGIDEHKVILYTTMFDGGVINKTIKLSEGKKINLLFLSRFIKEKGIYELLAAFSRLSNKHDELYLNFAGTGEEEEKMQAWVEGHNLTKKVKFWGYVRDEDKARVFDLTDIFVFPTYYGEGCPVSLLEAMAAGLGVVTTPVGGIPDVILSPMNGILISEKVTENDVYNALEKLLAEPEYLESMKLHNAKDAWQRFEASVVTKKIEDVYHA